MDFELLLNEVKRAKDKKSPFVMYKYSDSKRITALIQKNSEIHELGSFTESGFIFAPFDNKQRSIIFPFECCDIMNSEFQVINPEAEIKPKRKILVDSDVFMKQHHISIIKKGLKLISEGSVLKVVLSRKEEIEISTFELKLLFKKLLRKYPLAFVYIWYHPQVGLWMGATPETLLKVKNINFKTMALAGTQTYSRSEDVIWGEKEIEEQRFVTDFIVKQLKGIKLNVSKPYTLKAGSLLHICTEINGQLNSVDQLGNIIKKLHPTPAICGLPKKDAKSFILKNENYNREFYSGFLGELNRNNTSNLFVNLRCMKIKNKLAILYVGGGITAGSIPENEWEETLSKSEIMKSIILQN